MAGEDRTATRALAFERELREKPFRYRFYAAVRKLECLHSDKPRLGESVRASDDAVRLGQTPDLTFAPAELASFESVKEGGRPWLLGYFFGVFGPNGPLPIHLTEYARDRLRNHNDPTLVQFANLFHHRLLSLFYRAWANAQPTVCFDRPQTDRFSVYAGALLGIGMPSLRARDQLPDYVKLHHAGRFACQAHPAEGLRDVIESFFGLPVRIREFIGEWLRLPRDSYLELGKTPDTGTVGVSAVLGERVWEYQQKFRIVFGPLGFEDFERLLPVGDSLARLVALVRNYIGDQMGWDVNLVLKKEDVPDVRLGQTGYLGWTTWLKPRLSEEDAGDALFDPLGRMMAVWSESAATANNEVAVPTTAAA